MPPNEASRSAILVLGMHRSGTSAVTRLLNLRGAGLGRDLLPAKADNERGFWENRAIVELHERLLQRAGLRWHDLLGADDRLQEATRRELGDALPGVLDSQFDAAALFVVKDPRLSLLVPVWSEALAALAVRPLFVITIRHPDEVAASLARRDGLPVAQSHLLWLQHLVEAERATRGQARVFVHYERLLSDWRAELARMTRSLYIRWPDPNPGFEDAASEFIAPALRHHRGDDAGTLPTLLERVYGAACSAAADSDADFDAASAGYDEWMQLAAPLQRALAERAADAEVRHGGEIARARASADDLADQIRAARSNIATLVGEQSRAREVVAQKEAEIDGARSLIERIVRELELARQVVTAKDQELGAARRNIDALTAELGGARRNIDALAAELAAARENSHALATEIAQARDAFAHKAEELDAARASVESLAADIDRARESHAAKEREIDAARMNIDNLVAEIDRARQAHDARDATEAALQTELQARLADLSALRRSRWFRLGRRLRVIGGPEE